MRSHPNASYSVTLRVETHGAPGRLGRIATAIGQPAAALPVSCRPLPPLDCGGMGRRSAGSYLRHVRQPETGADHPPEEGDNYPLRW
jgi:hypothetical protein